MFYGPAPGHQIPARNLRSLFSHRLLDHADDHHQHTAADTTAGYVLTRETGGSFGLHPVGGSSSTKVLDGTSDGGDTYTLSPAPQGTVLVWVDGLLETDYTVTDTTLTFGTAPTNGSAIVAWASSAAAPSLTTSASTSPVSPTQR